MEISNFSFTLVNDDLIRSYCVNCQHFDSDCVPVGLTDKKIVCLSNSSFQRDYSSITKKQLKNRKHVNNY